MSETGISLKSQCTLRDYTHHIAANERFSGEVDTQLCESVKMSDLEEWQKHIVHC